MISWVPKIFFEKFGKPLDSPSHLLHALLNVHSLKKMMQILEALKMLGLKYMGAAHRDCNMNVGLNYKAPIVFQNLKEYVEHLVMQELAKFSFKINAIRNA